MTQDVDAFFSSTAAACGSYNGTTYKTSGEPALLVELQRFIRNEMLELGGDGLPPGDATRMSVYRNAFQAFIDDFRSYQGVLSAIKSEYEHHIASLDAQARKVPQLENQLAMHKYEVAEQQSVMVRDLVDRIEEIKGESAKWKAEASSLRDANAVQARKIAALEEDIHEKTARLKEEEVNRTTVAETEAKLHATIADGERRVATLEATIRELQRDHALMSENLNSAETKLHDLKEAYKDTVPMFEHELLQAEHDSYKSRFEQQRELTMKMHQQILDIQQKHEQFIRDLEKRFAERLRHATPDWDYIGKRCPGNIETFWTPCNGMNCNETIVSLIHMIVRGGGGGTVASIGDEPRGLAPKSANGLQSSLALASRGNLAAAGSRGGRSRMDLSSGGGSGGGGAGGGSGGGPVSLKQHRQIEERQTFFVGLGFASTVPRYLRCKGRVKNRNLTKKHVLLLIRDVWATKVPFDEERAKQEKPKSQLGDYFYQYLKKRFSAQETIAEWGYNVLEACKSLKTRDTECWLFLDILEGRLDETVYHHVQTLVESIRTTFGRLDANLNDGVAAGMVPKAIVLNTLQEIWKHKSPAQIKELTTALDADQPSGDVITYSLLFQEHAESAFLEAVKMQEMEERAQYMRDLEAAVLQYHGATATALTTVEFSRILGRFDVDKKKSDIDTYVARGFAANIDKLKPRDSIPIGRFLTNLSRGVLRRG
ncbi:Translin-associated factor X-interacting protein 1 [Blastocladiella emersonii ATCC 22665]|nr:Translin-associated factor X-interacting protein 1 [Blastocladiella emersonii ATCC 22665]